MKVLKLERKTIEGLFDSFWSSQLRRVAKGAARREYLKRAKTVEMAEHINGKWLEQVDHYGKKEKEFIPHPRKWLYDERWDDEIEDDLEAWKKS